MAIRKYGFCLLATYYFLGSELLAWPNKRQRESAQWLIKNGADIINGSHPHVAQKPEIFDGKPIFFSLGNHLVSIAAVRLDGQHDFFYA